MSALGRSKSSVTSYLPYEKGIYFSESEGTEKISVAAERQRRYRSVKRLKSGEDVMASTTGNYGWIAERTARQ